MFFFFFLLCFFFNDTATTEIYTLSLHDALPIFDLLDIQKAIEVHPYIETALISRRFPSTLRIDIVERVPVAFLNGTHLFAVDETGFLLPRLKSVALHGLPIITGIDNFRENPGAMVESDRVIQAINLFNLIRSVDSGLYQNLSEVHRSEERRVGKECRSRW